MAYTTIKKPSDYFNTKLYTGDGSSSRNITGVNFQPDWTWVKSRNSADYNNMITDSVRGTPKMLKTDSSAAEDASPGAGGIGSFDSDGFTISTGSINNTNMNNNGTTYVGWNWLGANGTTANTDGSISSTVSANTTSGFSIVKFTGTGANGTVGHGLGVKPAMIIQKNLSISSAWSVWHKSFSGSQVIYLNETGAVGTNTSSWNSTEPTSSVFSVGSGSYPNGSGNEQIYYVFAEKQGYSKFGSYVGNGSTDGTFVYTGFKPAFILSKDVDAAENWFIQDTTRNTSNPVGAYLRPNLNDAEGSFNHYDILSNGFKNLYAGGSLNGSGRKIIYMAFAEQPLVGDNPATAR